MNPDLAAVTLKCLAKEPSQRYQTAEAASRIAVMCKEYRGDR